MDTRQLLSLTGENVLEKIPSEIADESLNGMLKLMMQAEMIRLIQDIVQRTLYLQFHKH